MQSFKQWRMLNESLFPLGLSNTPNVAPIVSQFQFDEKKKNMDANPEMEDEDEDEVDDEEVDEDEDEESEDDGDDEGDDAPAFKKKGGDEESSFPAFMKKKGMKKKKKMKNECDCDGKKKPIESDDSDDDEGDEDMGGDDEGDNGDGEGADMKRPLGFMKKKGMKKKMNKKMKKESANPQNDFLQSFNSYTAPGNQMTSEDAWWKSVNSHFNNPDQKFGDGFTEYMEDYLIDPNAAEQFRSENDKQKGPTPGEVGFAPQQRMGYFGTPEGQA